MTEQERVEGFRAAVAAATAQFGVQIGASIRQVNVVRDGVQSIELTPISEPFIIADWQPPESEPPATDQPSP